MLLSMDNELDEWLKREETREESIQEIAQKYIDENQPKLEFWQSAFSILLLLRIIFLIAIFIVVVKLAIKLCYKRKNDKKLESKETIIYREQKPEEPTIYQAKHGECSPTGWIYDRDTMKWDPPKQLIEESKRKWRWDEEKRIWIDQEKEARIKRYREYRKAQGKEPTYEEWKEAKLEAERKKSQDQSAPAPGQNEPENCKE